MSYTKKYNYTEKPGRPITYSLDINERAKEYLQKCEDEEYDYNKTVGSTSNSYEKRIRVNLPSIEGLAVYLKVSRSTIYLWEKDYKDFSDTLEEIRAKQAKVVMEKGLSGDYNPTIAKLILSNNHGYKERTDSTTNDKDLPTPILGILNDISSDNSSKEDKESE